ncbi:hypothetical protein GWI33_014451 [Rhynchophorus ferrugineus]|uniref:Uncharacterized protein n=1 Tax=Rhynchophorus ferrugineus TaxID=354439 RepID=A0A834I4H6_RHYFE|nr:hypothetical protein GWI33_014451 [Rhynchophorus ferrugineus]
MIGTPGCKSFGHRTSLILGHKSRTEKSHRTHNVALFGRSPKLRTVRGVKRLRLFDPFRPVFADSLHERSYFKDDDDDNESVQFITLNTSTNKKRSPFHILM